MVEQSLQFPVKIDLKFPLPDGRMLVQGPLTYNTDGVATQHNCEFIKDPRFAAAYAFGMTDGPAGRHLEWRVHMALWTAAQSAQLQGDFIECGVNTGIVSGAIMTYLDFAKLSDRTYYLLDTFAGIPEEQITDAERKIGVAGMNAKYQGGDDLFSMVRRKFARWPNATLIRGRVPDTLAEVTSQRFAFASIDMNVSNRRSPPRNGFGRNSCPELSCCSTTMAGRRISTRSAPGTSSPSRRASKSSPCRPGKG